MLDPLPDFGNLSDEELRDLIDRYVREENEVSYRRRLIHGYIDILRAELQARKKGEYGAEGALGSIDVEQLSRILSGKGMPGGNDEPADAES